MPELLLVQCNMAGPHNFTAHPQCYDCRLDKRSRTAAVAGEAGNVDHQLSATDPDFQPGHPQMRRAFRDQRR